VSQNASKPVDQKQQEARILAYKNCRNDSLSLCESLSPEDQMIQGAPFASPPKWHLAHTTWFFATFVLEPLALAPGIPNSWKTLFNSYYNGLGQPHARAARGILSRPALSDIIEWRKQVDEQILLGLGAQHFKATQLQLIELGIQHEMQHQELLLTDLLYSFSLNPSHPAYNATPPVSSPTVGPIDWLEFDGGLIEVGASADGFSFDNEHPRHRHFLEPFAIANRLVTNGEYLEFIEADGYLDPQWWLSDGWDAVNREQWRRPLHWLDQDHTFSLRGVQSLNLNAPVCHLSGYEADAFARWADCRLPTEFEWEYAATTQAPKTRSVGLCAAISHPGWFGSVWQWTQSAYGPFPGFRADEGAVGEYNGKFMSGQWVLRGSSFATPESQQRLHYRNFFYPGDRWQFTGLRLAKTANPL
jgi:ergothioneine biosynthesis protein EgtB